jgi:mannitol-1-phosphate/altronate dehydrogenase
MTNDSDDRPTADTFLLENGALRVAVPPYNRDRLTPAVVHLGVGGFHRAHQAVYFDELAARGHTGWGVVGVGIARPELREVLLDQDNLFVVVERGNDKQSARVVGSMVEYLLLAEDPDAVIARLSDPRTRLVTMTITGDGYRVDADGSSPRESVFVAIVSALDVRRTAGLPPFTVLSCDNLPDAGTKARDATLATARRRSPELAEWIASTGCFPASMVDRITPQTTPEARDDLLEELAVADRWPVVTEPFAQWVIEDRFSDGRPPLDTVGAQFVTDVAPYKLIKARLLNGSHSVLGYLGWLAGHRTSAEAMADPVIARSIERMMADEIAPGLPDNIAGMELAPYQEVLMQRLSSAAIADPLERLCRRGSTKMADYVLPSLRDAVAAGRERHVLLSAVAAWCRYLTGTDLSGEPIEVQDPRLDELRPLAQEGPVALLGVRDLFGDLVDDAAVVDELVEIADVLAGEGVHAVLNDVGEAA